MTIESRETGQKGEAIAQAVMRRKGFRIEAVNWRAGRTGEIDLVAFHPQKQILAFVEVKTRKSGQYGTPAESVHAAKRVRLLKLAEAYLPLFLEKHSEAGDLHIRFDVISVSYPGHGRPADINHIEEAFDADSPVPF
jgi:putative endonuclease